jgi:PmbA protein
MRGEDIVMSLREQMIGKASAMSLLHDVLKSGKDEADQIEIVLEVSQQAVTRYANNMIHQNVYAHDTRVVVRTLVNNSCARAYTNTLTFASIGAAINNAAMAARNQETSSSFFSFPHSDSMKISSTEYPQTFFLSIADQTADQRAEWIHQIIDAVASADFMAFGTAIATVTERIIVNSLGIRSYVASTEGYLRVLADNGQGTGYADALARDASLINPGSLASEAIDKCRLNVNQIELPPGDYAAVLEPNCVADFIRFPILYGMGAMSIEDGTSFMADKLGEQVTSADISIWDDPLDPRCLPMPVDFEGVPGRRIELITQGIARDYATDASTSARLRNNASTNGHATDPWDEGHPLPEHIVMADGTSTLDELTRDLKYGLKITRLHYTHCPDPRRAVATGTTRDGTFLVENGEIVAAVKNLRITQPVLDLLDGVEAIGQSKTCRDWWASNGMGTAAYVVPSLRVSHCTCNGVTDF